MPDSAALQQQSSHVAWCASNFRVPASDHATALRTAHRCGFVACIGHQVVGLCVVHRRQTTTDDIHWLQAKEQQRQKRPRVDEGTLVI